ncbi:hypothetical protein GOB57_24055 [Sinorhizobium meliloti]|nr:hypothetical protein [Sinorhizobium meliloti]
MKVGDFERTFGAGADAVAIVEGFAREPSGGRDLLPRSSKAASKNGMIVDGDIIFAELGSGLHLVEKASIDTFRAEVASIDERSYATDLVDNVEGSLFLALRDSHDRTCALVHVVNDEVCNILGLPRRDEGVQVSHILFSAFRDRKWLIGTRFASSGWITDGTGRWHAVNDLPARLTVPTSFNLSKSPISVLPEELTVGGNLYLTDTKIEHLPNRLTVGGDLHLENTVLRSLPRDLTVGEIMFVDKFRVVLPSRVSVTDKFNADCIPCPSRPSVTVGGNLYLDLAALSILPNGATVIASDHDFGRYDLKRLIDRIPAGVNCMGLGGNAVQTW